MRAIVIDDDPQLAADLVAMLETRGIAAVAIVTGRGALERLTESQFDLLITDVLMPEVDGLEVIRNVRRRYPAVPIIAMSGGGGMLSADLGLQLSTAFGAGRILVKPFTAAELFATIAELVPSFASRSD